MVIFCRNSLYSILSLVFIIVSSSFILFSIGVEFLAFILLLIYIGAITVLFLFVVMMLQLHKDSEGTPHLEAYSQNYLIYLILGFKLTGFSFFFNKTFSVSIACVTLEYIKDIRSEEIISNLMEYKGSDTVIFLSLFSVKMFFFIIIGLILLFSMIASIAICLSQKRNRQ
jgi:NADH-quinone oxidoreductase subunit J